ncbi:hypothetical protein JIN80_15920, partial [Cerasicoccus arenae]
DSLLATTATFTVEGTYVLRLTGSDTALSASDDVTITVNPEASPISAPVLFDFGDAAYTTAGNWNNLTTSWAGSFITDAIDSDGLLTGISLSIDSGFTSTNGMGVDSGVIYPNTAARDSFYVENTQLATVVLDGLDISKTYTIRLFGSRAGAGNRGTLYTIGVESQLLDVTDNITTVIEFTEVMPELDGSIWLDVETDDGVGYGYLGVIELIEENGAVELWTSEDIGSVTAAGSATATATGFIIEGAGGMGPWQSSDLLHFAYISYTGDVTVTTRVDSVTAEHDESSSMIMMRPTTDDGSRFAAVGLEAVNGGTNSHRPTDDYVGNWPRDKLWGPVPPYWIRLQRVGDTFSSFLSPDGTTWTQLGTTSTVDMPDEILIGLGVYSRVGGTLTTAEFSNLIIE